MVNKKHPTSMLMYNNRGIIRETQMIKSESKGKENKKENHQRQEMKKENAAEHHPKYSIPTRRLQHCTQ
jgi:hypothetical protein